MWKNLFRQVDNRISKGFKACPKTFWKRSDATFSANADEYFLQAYALRVLSIVAPIHRWTQARQNRASTSFFFNFLNCLRSNMQDRLRVSRQKKRECFFEASCIAEMTSSTENPLPYPTLKVSLSFSSKISNCQNMRFSKVFYMDIVPNTWCHLLCQNRFQTQKRHLFFQERILLNLYKMCGFLEPTAQCAEQWRRPRKTYLHLRH